MRISQSMIFSNALLEELLPRSFVIIIVVVRFVLVVFFFSPRTVYSGTIDLLDRY